MITVKPRTLNVDRMKRHVARDAPIKITRIFNYEHFMNQLEMEDAVHEWWWPWCDQLKIKYRKKQIGVLVSYERMLFSDKVKVTAEMDRRVLL